MPPLEHDEIIGTDAHPEFRTYANGGVLILDGAVPNWVKTSTSGKWIFHELEREPASVGCLVEKTAARYDVPREMIEGSVREFLSALVDAGIATVVGSERPDARAALTERYGNDHLLAAPLAYVFFNILSDCNLDCPYCFVHRTPRSALSLERAKVLIDQMADLRPASILLCGGEPFLHRELVPIIEYLKQRATWSVRIISNGTAAQEARLREVAFLVDEIRVSFDGITADVHDATRGRGSFERAVWTLKKMWEWQAPAVRGIAFTPLPRNLHQVEHLYEFAAGVHAQEVKMNVPHRLAQPGRAAEIGDPPFNSLEFYEACMAAFDRLLAHYVRDVLAVTPEMDRPVALDTTIDPSRDLLVPVRRTSCGAGHTTIFVDERGDVYPCAAQCTRREPLGNAFVTPLREIYDGAARDYRRRVSVEHIPQCAACTYRFLCAGGCRANADCPEHPTPTCEYVKKRFDAFFAAVTRPVGKQRAAAQGGDGTVTEGELLCGS